MWQFLSKLDPNIIITVVTTVGAWVWSKLSAEKRATVEAVIDGVVDSLASEVVDHVPSKIAIDLYLKGARDYIEKRIWAVLAKRGIPRNSFTEGLVHASVERASARIGLRIADARKEKES